MSLISFYFVIINSTRMEAVWEQGRCLSYCQRLEPCLIHNRYSIDIYSISKKWELRAKSLASLVFQKYLFRFHYVVDPPILAVSTYSPSFPHPLLFCFKENNWNWTNLEWFQLGGKRRQKWHPESLLPLYIYVWFYLIGGGGIQFCKKGTKAESQKKAKDCKLHKV